MFNQPQNKELLDVTQRIMRAKEYTRPWHENIRRWRKLYNLEHYDRSLPGEVQFNDPTHTNTVDLAVGIMLANKVRFHAFGFSPSTAEQAITGKIEKLIEAVWAINDIREEKNNMYELFMNYVRDGGGVIYSPLDPNIAEESMHEMDMPSPDSQEGVVRTVGFSEPPIRIQVISPEKMILLPGGPKRWLVMGRVETMTALDVQIQYGVVPPDMRSFTDQMLSETKGEFVDCWDYVSVPVEGGGAKLLVRNTVLFNNFPLLGPRLMEGYKSLPYDIQFFKPSTGEPEGWHNIMRPMEGTVKLLERAINRRAYQIDVYTGLPLVSKTQQGRILEIDPGLFKHVTISTDESIEFPRWSGTPPDVQMHVDFLRSRVQQSGFSDVMFGSGPSQIAGYALSQLGDQNRIRLEQPIKHIELMLSTWAIKVLELLKVFAAHSFIHVYGQYEGQHVDDFVEVDKLEGYSVRAEIRPHFPAEEQRNSAIGSQARGLLSNRTIMERYYGIEQPEDEEKRIIIEMASRHPVTLQYALMDELQRRVDLGDKVAALTLQSLLNKGPMEKEGAKEGPPGAEQPMGMMSSTGEATSQEQGGVPAGQSPEEQMSKQANVAPSLME